MSSTVTGAGAAPGTSATNNPPAQKQGTTVNKEMFLQLLVAQVKNQNPLNPTDGVQFLTQLAQFSELEQMLDMRADLAAIRTQVEKAPATTGGQPTGANKDV